MDRIFGMDSQFMRVLNVIADLMLLNILTIICCIPVVTAGAALTALNYTCLKIARDEDSYITKMYFKSFRQNLKQSVPLWLIFAVVAFGYIYDFVAVDSGVIPKWLFYIVTGVFLLFCFVYVWVFPLLSRFDNTNRVTLENAVIISITRFPRTALMLVIIAVCALLCTPILTGVDGFIRMMPVIFMFSFSAPAYLCAKVYNPVFKSLEEPEENEGDAVRDIPADSPDPADYAENEGDAAEAQPEMPEIIEVEVAPELCGEEPETDDTDTEAGDRDTDSK